MKTSESKLASARAWKSRNRERLRQLAEQRHLRIMSDPQRLEKKRQQARDQRKRDKEKNKEYDRTRDPLKKWARARLRHQIAKGKIVRGVCEKCGNPNTDAHHNDYSKPLEVRWLCKKHHAEEHKNENRNP